MLLGLEMTQELVGTQLPSVLLSTPPASEKVGKTGLMAVGRATEMRLPDGAMAEPPEPKTSTSHNASVSLAARPAPICKQHRAQQKNSQA
jgi:hypothetical protein